MKQIAILGAGAMGTACAWICAQRGDVHVRLWARNPEYAEQIQRTRENARLLPAVKLPVCVTVTSAPAIALAESEVVIVCVPTRGLREALITLAPWIPREALLVSSIKGIENSTLLRPSQILQECCGARPVVVLGGPCHAEEITQRKPASIVAACDVLSAAEEVQSLLSTEFLRIYANDDQSGVELAAALKNVIAIAAGICDGLDFGDNAKSALITRGLAEMVRFGVAFGADRKTFYGLAGLGDLVTTCNSVHSRNRAVGEKLGQGQSLASIQSGMQSVAEGVLTTRSVFEIAQQRRIDMPIVTQVYRVLFEGKSPLEATMELMQRPLKFE
ncbi:MAG: NAD(P)H-dependent glycerol-3-phosphate dehydrogenase [Planctomycetota bacterium]